MAKRKSWALLLLPVIAILVVVRPESEAAPVLLALRIVVLLLAAMGGGYLVGIASLSRRERIRGGSSTSASTPHAPAGREPRTLRLVKPVPAEATGGQEPARPPRGS